MHATQLEGFIITPRISRLNEGTEMVTTSDGQTTRVGEKKKAWSPK
jgi:hypothetical protein